VATLALTPLRATVPAAQFYFAIGARSSEDDVLSAIQAGVHHLLVPGGSAMERRLRTCPDPADAPLRVLLDSGAWPPDNPRRPTIHEYIWLVEHWQRFLPQRFAGAFAYDTIGDPVQSARDEATLRAVRWPGGASAIIPVGHYPQVTVDQIAGPMLRQLAAMDEATYERWWTVLMEESGAPLRTARPAFALGGMVPANYSNALKVWYGQLLDDLVAVVEEEPVPLDAVGLHLLGIASPAFTQHPLVRSFDSSGPATRAAYGVSHIAVDYRAGYGLSLKKLARSRQARIAYWCIRYLDQAGLTWRPVCDGHFPDDGERYTPIAVPQQQLVLF
jgi:hypothetical protein